MLLMLCSYVQYNECYLYIICCVDLLLNFANSINIHDNFESIGFRFESDINVKEGK
jgi:hypothetical protein